MLLLFSVFACCFVCKGFGCERRHHSYSLELVRHVLSKTNVATSGCGMFQFSRLLFLQRLWSNLRTSRHKLELTRCVASSKDVNTSSCVVIHCNICLSYCLQRLWMRGDGGNDSHFKTRACPNTRGEEGSRQSRPYNLWGLRGGGK